MDRARTLALVVIGLGVGCGQKPPHVLLTMEDPTGVAEGFANIRVTSPPETSVSIKATSSSFPLTVTLTARSRGERSLRAEVLDPSGKPLARGETMADFQRTGSPTATIVLGGACDGDADCSGGPVCGGGMACVDGTCTPQSRPCVAVSFVSPGAGAVDVDLVPSLILAFNVDVTAESVPAAVSLAPSAGGPPVALNDVPNDVGTTFEMIPVEPLAPETSYALTVAAGVLPLSTEEALPSAVATTTSFTTRRAPDTTPPQPVADLVMERRRADLVRLTWTNPVDADLAGVLILRRAHAPSTDVPVDGELYAVNGAIGESTVVGWAVGTIWSDSTVSSDPYGYSLFAFDKAGNYSTGVSSPYVAAAELTWCPDQTGAMTVSGSASAVQQIHISTEPDQPWDSTLLHPPTADPIGTTVFPAGNDIIVGNTYYLRAVVREEGAVFVSEEAAVTAAPGTLEPVTLSTLHSGQSAVASLTFTPWDWTSFDAQIFPAGDPAGATPADVVWDRASAEVADAGVYQMRVRPAPPDGCSAGPWTTTAPFTWASNFLYVRQDASGDGSEPGSPAATIGEVLITAPIGTDVLVAGGTYAEAVNLRPGVRLFGGYSADFTARDSETYTSTITGGVLGTGDVITGTVVVDGFTIVPEVDLLVGAHPVLSNNVITTPEGATIDQAIGGPDAANVVIRGNLIVPGPLGSYAAGIDIGSFGAPGTGNAATITGNEVHANRAILVSSAAGALVADNRVVFGFAGVFVRDSPGARIENNTVIGPTSTSPTTASGIVLLSAYATAAFNYVHVGPSSRHCEGVKVWGGAGITIYDNIIVAAGCGDDSRGVIVEPSDGAMITNNTIVLTPVDGLDSAAFWFPVKGASTGSLPRISNNLVFMSASSRPVYGFKEGTGSGAANPGSIHSNLFVAVGSAVSAYYDAESDQSLSTIAEMETTLCAEGVPASNNVLMEGTIDQVFVDHDGPDDDLTTIDDNDLRPLPDLVAATQGGLDAGQSVCGGFGTGCPGSGADSCGEVTVDFAGEPRTVPYSIGAFEVD